MDLTAITYLKVKGQKVYYLRPLLIEIMFPFLKYFLSKNSFMKDKNNIYCGSGSCLFINLLLTKRVNYFSTDTFLFYEEAILAEKVNSIKFITKFYDKYEFKHLHSYSINKKFKFKKFKIMFDSLMIYLIKHRKTPRLISLVIAFSNITYIKIKEIIKWKIK